MDHTFSESKQDASRDAGSVNPVYVDAERLKRGGLALARAVGCLLHLSPESNRAAPHPEFAEAQSAVQDAIQEFNYSIGVAGFSQRGDKEV